MNAGEIITVFGRKVFVTSCNLTMRDNEWETVSIEGTVIGRVEEKPREQEPAKEDVARRRVLRV